MYLLVFPSGESLTRIFHKDRREKPENAVNARNSSKKTADILKYDGLVKRKKRHLHCTELLEVIPFPLSVARFFEVSAIYDTDKYFEDAFGSCNKAGMMFSGFVADRL